MLNEPLKLRSSNYGPEVVFNLRISITDITLIRSALLNLDANVGCCIDPLLDWSHGKPSHIIELSTNILK